MSTGSSNVQSRGATVLSEEPHGVYGTLFSKINLSPVAELAGIEDFQNAEALSEVSVDERVTAAVSVFLKLLKQSSQKVERLDKVLLDEHIASLDRQISRQLDAVMHHPDFQRVESTWRGANRWQVTLNDPRLREPEGADFYLSVRCRLPAAQVQDQFPRLCKVSTPDDVDHLINAALDGIPLRSLSHVPAAIALRLENQYFALDLGHAKGQAVLSEGVCAFYVPGTLAGVKLELFAVLRT